MAITALVYTFHTPHALAYTDRWYQLYTACATLAYLIPHLSESPTHTFHPGRSAKLHSLLRPFP